MPPSWQPQTSMQRERSTNQYYHPNKIQKTTSAITAVYSAAAAIISNCKYSNQQAIAQTTPQHYEKNLGCWRNESQAQQQHNKDKERGKTEKEERKDLLTPVHKI
mmetsp:Transcript_21299/g.49128  ORF Transcript_21299/g.49128 Transcript_21299/m.49128 type:complete len:105 (+) Transcript_21299:599-913(+)